MKKRSSLKTTGYGAEKNLLPSGEKEERLCSAIVSALQAGITVLDGEMTVLFANPAMERFFPPHDRPVVGRKCYAVYRGRSEVCEVCPCRTTFRTGQPAEAVIARSDPKGEPSGWFRHNSYPLFHGPDGRLTGVIEHVQDITDLIRTQKALRNDEERFRSIIETINDAYFEVDLKGNLIFFNDAFSRLFNMPPEELRGLNYRAYTDRKNAEVLFKAFNRVYLTGQPGRGIRHEVIFKEEHKGFFEASVSPVRDGSGKIIGFRGISRNITDLVEMQNALKASEERFRIAAECASDLIYEVDAPSGKLSWFGGSLDHLKRMLGAIPETLDEFETHIHPDDLSRRAEAVRLHLKDSRPYRHEYRLIGAGGNLFFVRGAIKGIRDEQGGVRRWIGTLSDITEQKKTEEELRDSLDRLHKTMGGIIRAMAATVESRDPYTAGHQQRVSNLARCIAQEMGLTPEQVEAVRMAGVVHDLGKISIPAEILSKPTELNDLETRLIQVHPRTGYDILKDIDFPWPVAQIVLQHHERLDGSGYPFGLKGDQILVEAQVLMVADVVEAIASHRPYRPARGIETALEVIEKDKGTKFNAQVVEACLRLFREKGFSFDKPFNHHQRA